MRTILRYLFWILLGFIIALFLLPIVFEDKINTQIKEELNKSINGQIEFEKAKLNFFNSFPDIQLSVSNINISDTIGNPITLVQNIDVGLNLFSFFKEEIIINEVNITKPELNLQIDKKGRQNFDIIKTQESNESSPSTFSVQLQEYKIENGSINYVDLQNETKLSIVNLNHSGKGRFNHKRFDLKTVSDITGIYFSQNNIPYLTNASIGGTLVLDTDLSQDLFTIKESALKLNAVNLVTKGNLKIEETAYLIDLNLEAANNRLEEIYSLIPLSYIENYESLEIKGDANATAEIKGRYDSNSNELPPFNLKITSSDGYISNKNAKSAISKLNVNASINTNKTDWSDMEISIPVLDFNYNNNPFSTNLLIQNALNNYKIKSQGNGRLDLAIIKDYFSEELIDDISGVISFDLDITTDKNAIENSDFVNSKFDTNIKSQSITLEVMDYPVLELNDLQIESNLEQFDLSIDKSNFGNSDFSVEGKLANPLSAIEEERDIKLDISIRSEVFDYNEFISLSESEELSEDSTAVNNDLDIDLKGIKMDYTADINTLLYEDYEITKAKVQGSFEEDELNINKGSAYLYDDFINFDGTLGNIESYIETSGPITGNLDIYGIALNMDNFTSESEEAAATELVLIPKDIQMTINSDFNNIKYDKYNFKDVSGAVELDNGKADFKEMQLFAFGGKMILNGFYDSSNEIEPRFSLDYLLDHVSFQDLFKESTSFKLLLPIAQFLEGQLNSTLKMEGPLGQDMMPKFAQLSADGFLETIDTKLTGFLPFDKLSDKLGIGNLKEFFIENTKNWFTMKDGAIILEPKIHEIDGMFFNFGGKHFVDQNIDYFIEASIPREKLKEGNITNLANQGLSFLEKEASKNGININIGEMIYLDIYLTGKINDPKIKITPRGSGSKSTQEIVSDELKVQSQMLKDTINKKVDNKIKEVNEQIESEINEQIETISDSAETIIKEEVIKIENQIKDQTEDFINEQLDSTISGQVKDSLTNKVDDVLGDETKDQLDNIKDKLQDFNPFKKKKGI